MRAPEGQLHASEAVGKAHGGQQYLVSLLNMGLLLASRMKAIAARLRFSESLTKRQQRQGVKRKSLAPCFLIGAD